ncbi:MAG: nitroreductase family deazaflavin-dependent oxidoreductase [Candidatus Omnitrophica bacterium]|nr:nitroreductase family deazaflavin-dependent oxidoreductase [Candidatus Omnitrophota bacterium]
MPSPFQQNAAGPMTYPAQWTLNRLLFKSPVIWWRMGLGPLLWRRMLLLTTWGRKSRLPRHTMLSYTLHEGKAFLISGWGARTDWYQNIAADPQTAVQLGRNPYSAIARRVVNVEEFATVMRILLRTGGDSHFRPWLKSLDIEYDLDDLVAKRDRIYLIALDPNDQQGPPAMVSDLTWLWAVILAGMVIVGLLMQRFVL